MNAGIACANIFFPKLAAFFAQYSNDKGYFMAALVMMLVGLPLMLNGFMQIKERVPPSPEKVTMRDTFHNLRQNKPLFIVLLSFFFFSACSITWRAVSISTSLSTIWATAACKWQLA